MMLKALAVAGLLLTLGACAQVPDYPAIPGLTGQPASAMLGELARVDALSPAQRRRELAELEGGRRLDAARRFQHAALLAHEDATDSLERSLQLLNTQPAPDARSGALLDLMKRSLKARIELAQQTARTQELQDKLEQIKALEKSLQQRGGAPKTP
jgi:hypothetical protein